MDKIPNLEMLEAKNNKLLLYVLVPSIADIVKDIAYKHTEELQNSPFLFFY